MEDPPVAVIAKAKRLETESKAAQASASDMAQQVNVLKEKISALEGVNIEEAISKAAFAAPAAAAPAAAAPAAAEAPKKEEKPKEKDKEKAEESGMEGLGALFG